MINKYGIPSLLSILDLSVQEIEDTFGFPVYSVVDVYDIIEYLEEDPANEENVTRIKNYLAVNGAK